ncbi:unnamed protein product [Closterium sp. Naga37s-1]|nr:unnamed protein product [Closterium sp. Naga37s-1]
MTRFGHRDLYNNVTSAATLPPRMDMHVFKEGIVPKWEDPQCEKGGSWTVFCRTKDMFDHVWLNVLLALIGEQFTEASDICGVVANARPNKDRVVLWTKTASNEAVQVGGSGQLRSIHWRAGATAATLRSSQQQRRYCDPNSSERRAGEQPRCAAGGGSGPPAVCSCGPQPRQEGSLYHRQQHPPLVPWW